mmetsp:Transcript_3072/g.8847  ORF Transcript_3072/g.8847 Transcript_3072/m.8847 type:complete len:397 (+) Transcript_3072:675-1865(+)
MGHPHGPHRQPYHGGALLLNKHRRVRAQPRPRQRAVDLAQVRGVVPHDLPPPGRVLVEHDPLDHGRAVLRGVDQLAHGHAVVVPEEDVRVPEGRRCVENWRAADRRVAENPTSRSGLMDAIAPRPQEVNQRPELPQPLCILVWVDHHGQLHPPACASLEPAQHHPERTVRPVQHRVVRKAVRHPVRVVVVPDFERHALHQALGRWHHPPPGGHVGAAQQQGGAMVMQPLGRPQDGVVQADLAREPVAVLGAQAGTDERALSATDERARFPLSPGAVPTPLGIQRGFGEPAQSNPLTDLGGSPGVVVGHLRQQVVRAAPQQVAGCLEGGREAAGGDVEVDTCLDMQPIEPVLHLGGGRVKGFPEGGKGVEVHGGVQELGHLRGRDAREGGMQLLVAL